VGGLQQVLCRDAVHDAIHRRRSLLLLLLTCQTALQLLLLLLWFLLLHGLQASHVLLHLLLHLHGPPCLGSHGIHSRHHGTRVTPHGPR
jgi:hypothetical protein